MNRQSLVGKTLTAMNIFFLIIDLITRETYNKATLRFYLWSVQLTKYTLNVNSQSSL